MGRGENWGEEALRRGQSQVQRHDRPGPGRGTLHPGGWREEARVMDETKEIAVDGGSKRLCLAAAVKQEIRSS